MTRQINEHSENQCPKCDSQSVQYEIYIDDYDEIVYDGICDNCGLEFQEFHEIIHTTTFSHVEWEDNMPLESKQLDTNVRW